MVALLAAAHVENDSDLMMSAAPKSFKEVTGELHWNYGAAYSVGRL